jgi:hypothetical protein
MHGSVEHGKQAISHLYPIARSSPFPRNLSCFSSTHLHCLLALKVNAVERIERELADGGAVIVEGCGIQY